MRRHRLVIDPAKPEQCEKSTPPTHEIIREIHRQIIRERQHGRPRAQLVVGPGGNGIPDQRRSSHRRARTQPRRQDAHRRRHRTRGRKHPRPPAAGRNLLLRRRRPRTLRRNRRRDAICHAAVPADRHNVHVVLTSSCRGSTKSSPTSKDGREASHLQAYLDEFVFRFNRRKTRHAAFRSLFRLATNAEPLTYSMLIEPEPCA